MASGRKGFGILYRIAYILGRYILYPMAFRFKYYGTENIPKEGGVLFASTHQSFLDPPLIGAASTRPVWFLARKTLFRNWFFGWLIRRLHAQPIDRGESDAGAIKGIIKLLGEGKTVVMFPEGTRTRDGKIGELKPGMAMFACRAEVPILPVVIYGAFEAWPRNKKIFRLFRRITVSFGKPIYRADYGEDIDKKDLYVRITEAVSAQMQEMYEARRLEYEKK